MDEPQYLSVVSFLLEINIFLFPKPAISLFIQYLLYGNMCQVLVNREKLLGTHISW